jgi:hypothetical protein
VRRTASEPGEADEKPDERLDFVPVDAGTDPVGESVLVRETLSVIGGRTRVRATVGGSVESRGLLLASAVGTGSCRCFRVLLGGIWGCGSSSKEAALQRQPPGVEGCLGKTDAIRDKLLRKLRVEPQGDGAVGVEAGIEGRENPLILLLLGFVFRGRLGLSEVFIIQPMPTLVVPCGQREPGPHGSSPPVLSAPRRAARRRVLKGLQGLDQVKRLCSSHALSVRPLGEGDGDALTSCVGEEHGARRIIPHFR